jgi:hypothetical protein
MRGKQNGKSIILQYNWTLSLLREGKKFKALKPPEAN